MKVTQQASLTRNILSTLPPSVLTLHTRSHLTPLSHARSAFVQIRRCSPRARGRALLGSSLVPNH